MALRNFFIGFWLLGFGTLIITKYAYPRPIETIIKANSLMEGLIPLAWLRPHADNFLFALGLGYIIAGVEIIHGTRFGCIFTVLLSLVFAFTFDNPLFTLYQGETKYLMFLSHILIISAICALHEKPKELPIVNVEGLIHKDDIKEKSQDKKKKIEDENEDEKAKKLKKKKNK